MLFLLFLLFLFQVTQTTSERSPSTCLLTGSLYHPMTDTCSTPLSQGPCQEGEMIVVGREPGVGVCRPELECGGGDTAALSLQGGVGAVCVCSAGHCNTLYTRDRCREGQVFLPNNYKVGHRECPDMFSCKKSSSCKGFKKAKKELSQRGSTERQDQLAYLETMVCHKKTRSVCCPDYDRESLLSPATLLASLVTPGARCTDNPCTGGTWPWRGEDGVGVCLPHQGADQCHGELEERDGRLFCPGVFDVKSVAPISPRNCGRRRRWIRGRCVRIFW